MSKYYMYEEEKSLAQSVHQLVCGKLQTSDPLTPTPSECFIVLVGEIHEQPLSPILKPQTEKLYSSVSEFYDYSFGFFLVQLDKCWNINFISLLVNKKKFSNSN